MPKTMLYLLTVSIEVPDEAFHLVDEATKEIQTAIITIAERLQHKNIEIDMDDEPDRDQSHDMDQSDEPDMDDDVTKHEPHDANGPLLP